MRPSAKTFWAFYILALSITYSASAIVSVGDPAPDIVLTDTDGKTIQLSAYRDTVVVLFFLGYS